MEVKLSQVDGNPWMIVGYSDQEKGMILRRISEDFENYSEAILAQTEFGMVFIDRERKFIDMFENMRDAFDWLYDYE